MKKIVGMKVVLVVLALSFAVPRPALAIGEFAPFTELVEDLADAIDQVIEETGDAIEEFGEDTKVAKHLGKGRAALEKARAYIAFDVGKKDPTEFPKNLKKVGSNIKKWSKSMDKAAKAVSTKMKGYPPRIDSRLLVHLNAWSVLIVVALVALINTALTNSLSYHGSFTKGIEKKHIKCKLKHDAAIVAFGMSGGVFVPGAFSFALKHAKKGIGLLVTSLTMAIVLMAFIGNMQAMK
ncbi:MAG: hypothetical protein ABFS86_15520 [Planctomycetota bacterium]